MAPDSGEHRPEHLRCQLAGIGVVARAVEAVEEREAGADLMSGPVRKGEGGPARAEGGERAVMGDAAQHHNGGEPGQGPGVQQGTSGNWQSRQVSACSRAEHSARHW